MDLNSLNGALEVLGSYLSDKGLKYEVVAIGGGKTHDVSEEFARSLAEALCQLGE